MLKRLYHNIIAESVEKDSKNRGNILFCGEDNKTIKNKVSETIMLDELKGKLIVSCQALSDEPLYGSETMGKMALAAKQGGAAAIRAQGVADITEIKKVTGLPVIGLIKQNYDDSDVYITPTMTEVEALIAAPCEMIALDMTMRPRPNREKMLTLVKAIKAADKLVLADISTIEEGVMAEEFGADAVSTTLSGYTPYSPQQKGPDLALVAALAEALTVPLIAEGRIGTPAELQEALKAGAYAVVVGSAITRPQLITKSFVDALT